MLLMVIDEFTSIWARKDRQGHREVDVYVAANEGVSITLSQNGYGVV